MGAEANCLALRNRVRAVQMTHILRVEIHTSLPATEIADRLEEVLDDCLDEIHWASVTVLKCDVEE